MANGKPSVLKVRVAGDASSGKKALEEVADAAAKTARKVDAAGDTARRAARRFDGLSRALSRVSGAAGAATAATGRLALATGAVSAGVAGLGAVGAAAFAGIAAGAAGAVFAVGGIGVAAAAQSAKVQKAFAGIGDGVKDAVDEASKAYVPLLVDLGKDLRRVFDGPAADAIGSAITKSLPVVESVLAQVAPAVERLIPLFTQLVDAGIPVAQVFADSITPILDALIPVLSSVVAAAAPFAEVFATSLVDAVTALLPALAPLLTALIELGSAVLPVLVPIITQVAAALAAGLTDAVVGLTPSIVPLIAAFGEVALAIVPIIPALLGLVVAVAPFLVQVVTLAADLIGQLVPGITAVVGWLTDLVTNAGNAEGATSGLQSIVAALSGFFTGTLVPAIRSVVEWFQDKIVPVIRDQVGPIMEEGRRAFDKIREAIDKNQPTIDALSRNFDRFISVARPIAEFILTVLVQVIGGALRLAFVAIGNVVTTFINVLGFLIRTSDRVGAAITSLVERVQNSRFVGGIMDGARSLRDLFDRAASAMDRARDAIGDLARKASNFRLPSAVTRALDFLGSGPQLAIGVPQLATFSAPAPGAFLTAASGAFNPTLAGAVTGSGTATVIDARRTTNVTVTGAIDPIGTARTIRDLLAQDDARNGRASYGFGGR